MGGPANYEQLPIPFAKDSDTSRAAAESIRDEAPKTRGRIYAAICCARDGLTGDEIEVRLNLAHQTVGPRLLELRGKDKRRALPVLITGYGSRFTRNRRLAAVWYALGREPKGEPHAGTE
jgi:hypothetical protein